MNSSDYGPRDLIGYGEETPDPCWPGNARIAINVVINYEEGSELTPVNGDDRTEVVGSELGIGLTPHFGQRDVNMESCYEYGSRAGIWRILRVLKDNGVKGTAYAVSDALRRHKDVAKAFERDGHEITSHGWRWIDRSGWTEEQEREYILKAINEIMESSPSGQPPKGWYWGMVQTKASPRSRSLVAQVFREQGLPLLYYSDDYSDDLPHWIPMPGGKKDEGLLIVPYTLDNNDYKNATAQDFTTPDDFANYLIGAFDELYREGVAGHAKMMSIGLHARIIGRPGRVAGLRKFLEYASSKEGVWFARRDEIAEHWAKKFPYQQVA